MWFRSSRIFGPRTTNQGERVQKKEFSRSFCLGVTPKTGEAKEDQRDAKETAKKSDGAKTRSWAGATPLSALRSRK
jgi:hypothetical protein